MKVDLWWTPGNASFSQEPEEEFGEEVETRGHIPERALGIIAPFSTGHPREGAELGDGSNEEERPTMDATRRVIEGAAGRDGVSSAEEDAPMDAQFAEPDTWRPFTEDPIAFLNKIMPAAGLPTARVIGADQSSDAYCQEIIPVLQRGQAGTAASRQELDRALVSGRARESRLRSIRKQEGYLDSFKITQSGLLCRVVDDTNGLPRLDVVIPLVQRDTLIAACHDALIHQGRDRTCDALEKSRLWWPSMKNDVHLYIKLKCPTCAFNKVGPAHGAMHTPPNGRKPWQAVCIDALDLETTASGRSGTFQLACRLGRSVRCYPISKTFDSKAFINLMLFAFIPDVGCVPEIMLSDRASVFLSELCEIFYRVFRIGHRPLDSHMHTGVALLERFNHTLRQMARAAYFDNKLQWDLMLPWLVLFYNSLKQKTTGFSPFFIEHGREVIFPWLSNMELQLEEPEGGEAADHIRRQAALVHIAWDAALQAADAQEIKRREEHNKKYQTNVVFAPGDWVLILQPGRIHKMSMPHVGPFRVVEGPDDRDRYRLRDLHFRVRHRWFSVKRLKAYPPLARGVEELGEDYYIIERIVGHRLQEGKILYKVRWQGYSSRHDSEVGVTDMNASALEEMVRYNIQHSLGEANVQNVNEAYDGAAGSASAHSDEAEAQSAQAVTGRGDAERPAATDFATAGSERVRSREARDARAAERQQRLYGDAAPHFQSTTMTETGPIAQQQSDRISIVPESPAASAAADESAEAEEETAMQQCGVRTRAGSEHDRRLSDGQSAQPTAVGADSTARQQYNRISIQPGSPAASASADESAEAEEDTARQQCGVRTRAGSEHDRRLSDGRSAQPTAVGADSTARQQSDRSSIVPGSPAASAAADESAEAEEETARQQCGVRTRAGSEHDRRLSDGQSAQPTAVGADSTARQQYNRISIQPGSPAASASADESAEAEEETAMQQCGVRTRAGSEHDRRLSDGRSAQPTAVGADSTARQQDDRISIEPGSPAASAAADESAEAEEEMTMQQSSRQARAASRQARLYGDSQPAQLTILNAPSHGSHGRIWPRRSTPTSRTTRGVQWYQGERRRAAAVEQESSDTASD